MQSVPAQVKFARELYNKVKAEFPEVSRDLDSTQLELTKHKLGTPRFNEGPTGRCISRSVNEPPKPIVPADPHPVGSIDLRTTNPHQTGALFSYMTVNRGILSSVTSDFYSVLVS